MAIMVFWYMVHYAIVHIIPIVNKYTKIVIIFRAYTPAYTIPPPPPYTHTHPLSPSDTNIPTITQYPGTFPIRFMEPLWYDIVTFWCSAPELNVIAISTIWAYIIVSDDYHQNDNEALNHKTGLPPREN